MVNSTYEFRVRHLNHQNNAFRSMIRAFGTRSNGTPRKTDHKRYELGRFILRNKDEATYRSFINAFRILRQGTQYTRNTNVLEHVTFIKADYNTIIYPLNTNGTKGLSLLETAILGYVTNPGNARASTVLKKVLRDLGHHNQSDHGAGIPLYRSTDFPRLFVEHGTLEAQRDALRIVAAHTTSMYNRRTGNRTAVRTMIPARMTDLYKRIEEFAGRHPTRHQEIFKYVQRKLGRQDVNTLASQFSGFSITPQQGPPSPPRSVAGSNGFRNNGFRANGFHANRSPGPSRVVDRTTTTPNVAKSTSSGRSSGSSGGVSTVNFGNIQMRQAQRTGIKRVKR